MNYAPSDHSKENTPKSKRNIINSYKEYFLKMLRQDQKRIYLLDIVLYLWILVIGKNYSGKL